jgi:hypothetical protein
MRLWLNVRADAACVNAKGQGHMPPQTPRKQRARTRQSSSSELDPTRLAEATNAELAATFRGMTTLPLDRLMNAGGHQVDYATRTIFNDEHWKGWLPRGTKLPLRDNMTRLATGYAKRFWKQGQRYLGETRYLDGKLLVHHSLEEITIDRPTNDLEPGAYILLRYTDAVFENLFYDVMRAGNDGVIVYGGYTGKFPEGTRGFTGVLMRRYSFAQLGVRDHQQLFSKGDRLEPGELKGTWRLSGITTANHATPIGDLTFASGAAGRTKIRCVEVSKPEVAIPSLVLEHFTTDDAAQIERELRTVDAKTIVGRWAADIGPLYARFISASPGLFRRETDRGKHRYILRYVLSR